MSDNATTFIASVCEIKKYLNILEATENKMHRDYLDEIRKMVYEGLTVLDIKRYYENKVQFIMYGVRINDVLGNISKIEKQRLILGNGFEDIF